MASCCCESVIIHTDEWICPCRPNKESKIAPVAIFLCYLVSYIYFSSISVQILSNKDNYLKTKWLGSVLNCSYVREFLKKCLFSKQDIQFDRIICCKSCFLYVRSQQNWGGVTLTQQRCNILTLWVITDIISRRFYSLGIKHAVCLAHVYATGVWMCWPLTWKTMHLSFENWDAKSKPFSRVQLHHIGDCYCYSDYHLLHLIAHLLYSEWEKWE